MSATILNFENNREKLNSTVFKLKLWQEGGQTNFSSQLFDLISKADVSNRNKLRVAFPTEVFIFEEWQNSKNEETFFKKWGL